MARPRTEDDDRVSTNVRFPPDLIARLDTAAAERSLSRNWLICKAVEQYLDDLIPLDELVLTRPRPPVVPSQP